jgi:phosphomevalonate kinase
MITARAPGKLLLLGEYAVLEGAPALVMAVDRWAEVTIENHQEGVWLFSSLPSWASPIRLSFTKDGRISAHRTVPESILRQLGPVRAVFARAWRRADWKFLGREGMRVGIDTRGFALEGSGAKLGLGSSAALTVALLAALWRVGSPVPGRVLARENLFREAFDSHRRAQKGAGSGADVAASVYGGIVRYEMGKGRASGPAIMRAPDLPRGVSLAVVWSGKPASTPYLLGQLRDFRRRDSSAYRRAMADLAETSTLGCEAYMSGDAPHFLESVERVYDRLDILGRKGGIDIISCEHREASRTVKDHGGVYKPSGAGGGDLGVAFFAKKGACENALPALRERGFRVVDLGIDRSGIVTGEDGEDED